MKLFRKKSYSLLTPENTPKIDNDIHELLVSIRNKFVANNNKSIEISLKRKLSGNTLIILQKYKISATFLREKNGNNVYEVKKIR